MSSGKMLHKKFYAHTDFTKLEGTLVQMLKNITIQQQVYGHLS